MKNSADKPEIFSTEESNELGAFIEDALNESDALDALTDEISEESHE